MRYLKFKKYNILQIIEDHMLILMSIPRGGGIIWSSLILTYTYFNLDNASCFLNYYSLIVCLIIIYGLTY